MQGILRKKIFQWITQFPVMQGETAILLAVSGGVDSVAMAHVLVGLKKHRRLPCGLVIAHINHCLRGAESDADEAFVIQLGQSLAIPVISQRVDVQAYAKSHKLSIETAGRVLRLSTLAQMAERNGCDAIATAHHKDDLAETMIHRLMRGTGFRGLCGIWPVSVVYGAEFIRPMLGLRRAEIIQYCKDNSIQWREDASNADVNFTRNRIRHHLLPTLKDGVVGTAHPTGLDESDIIVGKLEKLSLASRRFQLFTEKLARTIVDKGDCNLKAGQFTLKQEQVRDVTAWVFYEVIREVLVKLGVGLRRYKREHFEMIRELIGKKRGRLVLPENIAVKVFDGNLIFSRIVQGQCGGHGPPCEEAARLEIGDTIRFGPWRISSQIVERSKADIEELKKIKDSGVEWFDADKVVGPVEIRGRSDGDRFWPIGASSEKKVGRFLIDAQLPRTKKAGVFVVADAEKILWVASVRMCEQAKMTDQTRKILEIRIDRAW